MIDVLYIGGIGRSGSTLLAYLLGQLDGYVVAGELKFTGQLLAVNGGFVMH